MGEREKEREKRYGGKNGNEGKKRGRMKVKKIRWEKGKGPREKRNKKRVNMGKKVKRDEGCQGEETGEKKRGRKEEKREK